MRGAFAGVRGAFEGCGDPDSDVVEQGREVLRGAAVEGQVDAVAEGFGEVQRSFADLEGEQQLAAGAQHALKFGAGRR